MICLFQSGLMMACYQGYVDVVIALASCPYIDINWQDNEGNTALITAVQAGILTTRVCLNCLQWSCLCQLHSFCSKTFELDRYVHGGIPVGVLPC